MIRLATVVDRLNVAADLAADLDGVDLTDTDTGNPTSSRTSDRQRAAGISRELLHLADYLDHTAALVREQYWAMKGMTP